ncbi:MAG: hypothetical protein ACKOQM_04970 [Novosphingobium sp.]
MIAKLTLFVLGGAAALLAAADLIFGLPDGSSVVAKGLQRLSGKPPKTDMDNASMWAGFAILMLFVGVVAIGAVKFWSA